MPTRDTRRLQISYPANNAVSHKHGSGLVSCQIRNEEMPEFAVMALNIVLHLLLEQDRKRRVQGFSQGFGTSPYFE